jgi:hypothetical protein
MLARGHLRLVLSAPGGGADGGQAMPDGSLPRSGGWNRFSLEVTDLEATVETLRQAVAHFRKRDRGGRWREAGPVGCVDGCAGVVGAAGPQVPGSSDRGNRHRSRFVATRMRRMDDMVTVALGVCPVCRHRFDSNVTGEVLMHAPVDCGCVCCRGTPRCSSCREPFCVCVVH